MKKRIHKADAGFFVLAILLVILASGCLGGPPQPIGSGLSINIEADPPDAYEGSPVILHIDTENMDTKDYFDIRFMPFNLRGIQMNCPPEIIKEDQQTHYPYISFGDLMPGKFNTEFCDAVIDNEVGASTVEINSRISFRTAIVGLPQIDLISEREYNKRKATGQLEEGPRTFAYIDKNIGITVSFSEPFPIIDRPTKQEYMYIDIRDIGSGKAGTIKNVYITNLADLTNNIEQIQSEQGTAESCETFECLASRFLENWLSGTFVGDLLGISGEGGGTVSTAVVETSDILGECSPTGSLTPIGKQFERITCTLVLPGQTEFLQNYKLAILVPYSYEERKDFVIGIRQKE